VVGQRTPNIGSASIWRKGEIDSLIAAAGNGRNPVRDRLLILMAFRHALRVSELVDIRWQQIHLDTATIDIRRAKNGTPGIHGLQGDELRLLRALRREHLHADFVFVSERKAPLSVDGAQKLIDRLGASAGLPFPIHAHMLRHAAGYALAARGVDPRTLQAFMGHRSIANTVVYTSVADKRIRNIWGKWARHVSRTFGDGEEEAMFLILCGLMLVF
jgi:integrase